VAIASIIIPAYNESRVIGRLLSRLVESAREHEYEIFVVANGCTDDTAEVARSFGPKVRVLSLPTGSKRGALAAGNDAATVFPRVYVDADVELGADDIRALAAALSRPGILAVAPRLDLALAGVPWLLRWYWDIWSRLPEVRRGLFGRGVLAVSETGYKRIAGLPPVIADDLVASLAFTPAERAIADDARVIVHPPRTFRDLIRIRVRAATGTAQVEQTDGAPPSTARTRPSDILAVVWKEPVLAVRAVLFLLVAVAVRVMARRQNRTGRSLAWLRDESSRLTADPPDPE
jgi:glycosyltransferase involved in cell wall biosynthesis